MRFLVLRYLVWPVVRPFALLAAVFGACWLVELGVRVGLVQR